MVRTHDCWLAALAAGLIVSTCSVGDEPPGRQVANWGVLVDPSRDCKLTHDPAEDRLTIAVPGTPHVLSVEIAELPMAAPRVVQAAESGFRATVRVTGKLEPGSSRSTHYAPYHGAGLVIWKDERNYLRIERAVATIQGHATPYLNYELREDGRLAFSKGLTIKDQPIYLKVERESGEIRTWRSEDGKQWFEMMGPAVSMAGRVQVGVVAVNSARRPLRAELERFRIESISEPALAAGERSEAK